MDNFRPCAAPTRDRFPKDEKDTKGQNPQKLDESAAPKVQNLSLRSTEESPQKSKSLGKSLFPWTKKDEKPKEKTNANETKTYQI
ncbi:hypothetical protein HNY73_017014 [Argiope bruennichi]|uniref:Uncharacterized protein n=1 Tax=Argiope bruennichi TaxID=94029 RepID=A0A8T0EPK3_ARGBR|nr:hypothetical protein HNY73_017014 [Argiope bruennichi]